MTDNEIEIIIRDPDGNPVVDIPGLIRKEANPEKEIIDIVSDGEVPQKDIFDKLKMPSRHIRQALKKMSSGGEINQVKYDDDGRKLFVGLPVAGNEIQGKFHLCYEAQKMKPGTPRRDVADALLVSSDEEGYVNYSDFLKNEKIKRLNEVNIVRPILLSFCRLFFLKSEKFASQILDFSSEGRMRLSLADEPRVCYEDEKKQTKKIIKSIGQTKTSNNKNSNLLNAENKEVYIASPFNNNALAPLVIELDKILARCSLAVKAKDLIRIGERTKREKGRNYTPKHIDEAMKYMIISEELKMRKQPPEDSVIGEIANIVSEIVNAAESIGINLFDRRDCENSEKSTKKIEADHETLLFEEQRFAQMADKRKRSAGKLIKNRDMRIKLEEKIKRRMVNGRINMEEVSRILGVSDVDLELTILIDPRRTIELKKIGSDKFLILRGE